MSPRKLYTSMAHVSAELVKVAYDHIHTYSPIIRSHCHTLICIISLTPAVVHSLIHIPHIHTYTDSHMHVFTHLHAQLHTPIHPAIHSHKYSHSQPHTLTRIHSVIPSHTQLLHQHLPPGKSVYLTWEQTSDGGGTS